MSEPWFDPNLFGAWVGGLGGGLGGLLMGVLGGLTPWLAMQGKGRRAMRGLSGGLFAVGVIGLLFGVVALTSGQPYGIWYASLLCGLILSLMGGLCCWWLVPWVYGMAEKRRQAAEKLRAGL